MKTATIRISLALATLALATKSGQLTIEQADRMLREYAAATYRAVNG